MGREIVIAEGFFVNAAKKTMHPLKPERGALGIPGGLSAIWKSSLFRQTELIALGYEKRRFQQLHRVVADNLAVSAGRCNTG